MWAFISSFLVVDILVFLCRALSLCLFLSVSFPCSSRVLEHSASSCSRGALCLCFCLLQGDSAVPARATDFYGLVSKQIGRLDLFLFVSSSSSASFLPLFFFVVLSRFLDRRFRSFFSFNHTKGKRLRANQDGPVWIRHEEESFGCFAPCIDTLLFMCLPRRVCLVAPRAGLSLVMNGCLYVSLVCTMYSL